MDKGKVTAKVNLSNVVTLQTQSRPHSRPSSPFKTKTPSSTSAEPASRIKAKVSSSATIVVGRSTSSSSNTENSIVKSTTRPPSPFKQSRGHARVPSSSRSAVDVQISRPKVSLAPHELSRQRSLTSTLEVSITGARRNGGSFHHTPPLSPSARLATENASTSPAVRVKAKVSSVVKSHGLNASSTPASPSPSSSPPYATTRPIESRPRATSITDLSIFNPKSPLSAIPPVPVAVHPITTPTSAANPHRYSPRIPPNTVSTRFQSLSPLSNRDPDSGVHHIRVSLKVDPAAIPLPPQSPPTSTLSFSSQSSKDTQCSSASGSTVPTLNSNLQVTPSFTAPDLLDDICDPNSPRHSLDNPAAYADHPKDPDRKIRAEAKTNRKIEDLEITNRSLLAINASLETTKHKHLAEIRELKRKLRESRLMLPPRTFRTLKSSLGPEDVADDEDIDDDSNNDDSNNDDDDGDDGHDETYKRIRGILGDLLETGRRALRAEPRDFEQQGGGVKVLSAEEVRSWRNNMGDDISSTHSAPTDADTDDEHLPQRNMPTTPRAPAMSEDDSEKAPSRCDDEEAIVIGGDAQYVPPITVTFS